MAKKKSLFKKLRKSASSLVAEPEAPVDEAILEAIAKPKIEAPASSCHCKKTLHCTKKNLPSKN